jgi:hypothetical protein
MKNNEMSTANTIGYVLNKENMIDADIDLFSAAIEGMTPEQVGELLFKFSDQLPGQLVELVERYSASKDAEFDLRGIVYGFNKVNAHTLVGKITSRAMKYMKTAEDVTGLVTSVAQVLPGMEYDLAERFGVTGDVTRPTAPTGPEGTIEPTETYTGSERVVPTEGSDTSIVPADGYRDGPESDSELPKTPDYPDSDLDVVGTYPEIYVTIEPTETYTGSERVVPTEGYESSEVGAMLIPTEGYVTDSAIPLPAAKRALTSGEEQTGLVPTDGYAGRLVVVDNYSRDLEATDGYPSAPRLI